MEFFATTTNFSDLDMHQHSTQLAIPSLQVLHSKPPFWSGRYLAIELMRVIML